ncbi:hypothetical protein [Pseudomonas piscis]|uniref:hypothetical protein n=1 Tax=Pseudomonas piscis TaxID=2614538 RepID=UPI0021D5BEDB|nr:hypothetical protein [Pseudomonas piscis]MCU7646180.1 hypothetical protein [Pseudomonas piscis]
MHRFAHMIDDQWVEHSYPPVFEIAPFNGGERVVAGVPGSDPQVLLSLARCLTQPLLLLFVLHTSREDVPVGRYMSPMLSLAEVADFIDEFKPLLCGDSRFDFWVHSPEDQATVVWDRHNLIYAYGPLESYASALYGLGFGHGEAQMPVPHMHYYHPQLDELCRQLIARFDWRHSPLQPEDEQ